MWKGGVILRGFTLGLLALFVAALAMPFFLTRSYAFDPGVGIGIRKDAPIFASLHSTISYSITVYNLGNYTITNVTITDTFPNYTTTSWSGPDLAPIGQPGDSFTIANILYTIREEDVVRGNPSYILNHAATTGKVIIQTVTLPVSALTNIVTFMAPPVGGFTVHMNIGDRSTPTIIYIAMLFITAAALPVSSTFRRKNLTAENAPKR